MKNSPLVLLIFILSCAPAGTENAAYEKLSRADKDKFNKYILLGKEVFNRNCASCHQTDGKGLRGVIPPLVDSDYLRENQDEIPCLLRYGTKDTIIVNGRSYPPEMPAHQLTNLELAEVITYINNSWGNEIGLVSVKKVDSLILNCN